MNFWNILIQNIPLTILIVLAILICGADIIKAIGVWKQKGKEKFAQENAREQESVDIKNEFKLIHERFDDIEKKFGKNDERLNKMDERIIDLTISDMHDIKSWIVDQYQKFYIQQGWIDAFNADTIDRRYEDYKKEGGNSYIDTLIDRLHSLPMSPDGTDIRK